MVILVSSFSIVLITAGNNPDTTMLVSPSSIIVAVNETFQIDIDVSGVSDLYGWEFKLGYNTSLLELVNITEGNFLNSSRDTYFVPKVMSADGYILAGCTSLRSVNGVSGNGTLATVEFRAKKLGSCTLDLYDTRLVNSAKQLVEHGTNDGTVTVSGCVVIRVQYKDGYPRSGADVYEIWPDEPPNEIWLGVSNESGYVESCGVLVPGEYYLKAFYGGSVFGPDEVYLYVDGNGEGSTTIQADYEITPPAIEILSPQNLTYTNRSVLLTYTICDFSPISWTGYSLDGEANITITGNTTLTDLSLGSHSIVVYSNDTFGNMGSSQTVYFTCESGCVVVTVLFSDYSPVKGAWINVKQGEVSCAVGRTNDTGSCAWTGILLEGWYRAWAYYPDSQTWFGDTIFNVNENGDGNATILGLYELIPPFVQILSPQNLTYTNGSVPFTFTVYDYSPISWIGYSLDDQANVTISSNTTLSSLSNGHHNIIVYANDSFGNMGESNRIFFVVGLTNLSVKTFGPHEINGVTIWIDAEHTTYYSPINIEVGIGWHTVKVSYGFLDLGPEEGSYIKYSFYCWDNGSTNNTRSLQLEKDRTIWALYKWKIIYLW